MGQERDQARDEVYERVPWETLEREAGDHRWIAYAIAGAVVLGAIAYTLVQNRAPVPVVSSVPQAVAQTSSAPALPIAPATTAAQTLVAEADLFAVHPERLIDQATTHAEWFAVEYFGFDGSDESESALAALLPAGLPSPKAPEGVQVFVDWVGASTATELSPLRYEVAVAVRSLRSDSDGTFVRQPTRLALIEVGIGEDGTARVLAPPEITTLEASSASLELDAIPDDLRAALEESHGQVIGGRQGQDGSWTVVVMAAGLDGVIRPTSVIVP